MKLFERIGIDLSRNIRIEDGVEWAAKNNVKYLDIQLDNETNAITTFDSKRVAAVRTILVRFSAAAARSRRSWSTKGV